VVSWLSHHFTCTRCTANIARRSIDLGVAFTYTGCGGRDLKGTKQNPKNLRTAPQTSHQTFSNPMNAALKRSAETRLPVRVIRGFKLDSPYAPAEGYRYDGLYVVERAWMAKGLTNGLLVCRYAFKRCKGQPDLPIRGEEQEKSGLEVRDGEGHVAATEHLEQKAGGVEQGDAATVGNGQLEEEKQEPVEEKQEPVEEKQEPVEEEQEPVEEKQEPVEASGPGVSDARPSGGDVGDDGCGDGEQEDQGTSNRVGETVGGAAEAISVEAPCETIEIAGQTDTEPAEPAEVALEDEPSQNLKPARESSWSAWGLVGKILGRA
jgi:E3 ubiquitin-protein ligase UHRF1